MQGHGDRISIYFGNVTGWSQKAEAQVLGCGTDVAVVAEQSDASEKGTNGGAATGGTTTPSQVAST